MDRCAAAGPGPVAEALHDLASAWTTCLRELAECGDDLAGALQVRGAAFRAADR